MCWFQWGASLGKSTTVSLQLVGGEDENSLFTLAKPLKLTPPVRSLYYTVGKIAVKFLQGTELLYPGTTFSRMTKDQIVINITGARLQPFAQYLVQLHYYRNGKAFHNILTTLSRFHITNAIIAKDIRLYVANTELLLVTGAAPASEFVITFDFSNFVQQFEIPKDQIILTNPTLSIRAEIIDLGGNPNGKATARTASIPTFSEHDKAAHIPLTHGGPTAYSESDDEPTFEMEFPFTIYPKTNTITIEVSSIWPDTAAFAGYDAFVNHFGNFAVFKYSCDNRTIAPFPAGNDDAPTVSCGGLTPNKKTDVVIIVQMGREDVHPFKIPLTIDGVVTLLSFGPYLVLDQRPTVTEFNNDHIAFVINGTFDRGVDLRQRNPLTAWKTGRATFHPAAIFNTSIVYNWEDYQKFTVLLDDTLNCTATFQEYPEQSSSPLLPLIVKNFTNDISMDMFIDKRVDVFNARPGSRVLLYCYNNINQYTKPQHYSPGIRVIMPHTHTRLVSINRFPGVTSPNEDWPSYPSKKLSSVIKFMMIFSTPPTTIAEAKERVVAFFHTATLPPGSTPSSFTTVDDWKKITTNHLWVTEVEQLGHNLAKYQSLMAPKLKISMLYDINNNSTTPFPAHQLFGGPDDRILMTFFVNISQFGGLSWDFDHYTFQTAHPNDVYSFDTSRTSPSGTSWSITPEEEHRFVIPTTPAEVSGPLRMYNHGAKCFSSRTCDDNGYCVNGTCHTVGIPLVWSAYRAGVFSQLGPFVDMTEVYKMIKTTPPPHPGEATPYVEGQEGEEPNETDGNASPVVTHIYFALVWSCIVAIVVPMLF